MILGLAITAAVIAAANTAAIVWLIKCVRKTMRQFETAESLLLSIENYTRKHRHAVATLTAAITLMFPEIKARLDSAHTSVVPTDLEDVDGPDQ